MEKRLPGGMWVWQKLAEMDPRDVCRRADVTYDTQTAIYNLKSFGCELAIALEDRRIYENTQHSLSLMDRVDPELCLSALWYLITAKDIPLSGKLIRPVSLPGGQIFIKGSHILPLQQVAEKYGRNPSGFITQAEEYGGEILSFGDASIKLMAYPRVPIDMVLWQGDEEFDDNVDILLDESCVYQIPLDIIWSTCLMSVMLML
jgi:hypothetical protein